MFSDTTAKALRDIATGLRAQNKRLEAWIVEQVAHKIEQDNRDKRETVAIAVAMGW